MAFDSECKPVILCVTWPHAYTSKFSFRTVRRPFFNFDKYSKLLMKLSSNHSVKKKKINNIVNEINALISLRYLQLQLDYLKVIFRYVFDSLLRHTEMYNLVHFCNVHLKILFHILLTEINIPSISIHKHPKMCWSNLISNKKFASLVK